MVARLQDLYAALLIRRGGSTNNRSRVRGSSTNHRSRVSAPMIAALRLSRTNDSCVAAPILAALRREQVLALSSHRCTSPVGGPGPHLPCLSVSCELDAHGLPFHALNL